MKSVRSWRDNLPDYTQFCNGVVESSVDIAGKHSPAYADLAKRTVFVVNTHPLWNKLNDEDKANIVRHELDHLSLIPNTLKREVAMLQSINKETNNLVVSSMILDYLENSLINKYESRRNESYAKTLAKSESLYIEPLKEQPNLVRILFSAASPNFRSLARQLLSQDETRLARKLAIEFDSVKSAEEKAIAVTKMLADLQEKTSIPMPSVTEQNNEEEQPESDEEENQANDEEDDSEPDASSSKQQESQSPQKSQQKEEPEKAGQPEQENQNEAANPTGEPEQPSFEKETETPAPKSEEPDNNKGVEGNIGDEQIEQDQGQQESGEGQEQSGQEQGDGEGEEDEEQDEPTETPTPPEATPPQEPEGPEEPEMAEPKDLEELKKSLEQVDRMLHPADLYGEGKVDYNPDVDFDELMKQVEAIDVNEKEIEEFEEKQEQNAVPDWSKSMENVKGEGDETTQALGLTSEEVKEYAKILNEKGKVSKQDLERIARKVGSWSTPEYKQKLKALRALNVLQQIKQTSGEWDIGFHLGEKGIMPAGSKAFEDGTEIRDAYLVDMPIAERTDWAITPRVLRRSGVTKPTHFIVYLDASGSMSSPMERGHRDYKLGADVTKDGQPVMSKEQVAEFIGIGILKSVVDAGGSVSFYAFGDYVKYLGSYDKTSETAENEFKVLLLSLIDYASTSRCGGGTKFDAVLKSIIEEKDKIEEQKDRMEVVMITDGQSMISDKLLIDASKISRIHTIGIKIGKETARRSSYYSRMGRETLEQITKATEGKLFVVNKQSETPKIDLLTEKLNVDSLLIWE